MGIVYIKLKAFLNIKVESKFPSCIWKLQAIGGGEQGPTEALAGVA